MDAVKLPATARGFVERRPRRLRRTPPNLCSEAFFFPTEMQSFRTEHRHGRFVHRQSRSRSYRRLGQSKHPQTNPLPHIADGRSRSEIDHRLRELELEWDIERVLEANASIAMLTSLTLGASVDRRWFALSGIVAAFLLQHAVQGWCPPMPILRRMGLRTSYEIDERYALKAIRGDFEDIERPRLGEPEIEALERFESEGGPVYDQPPVSHRATVDQLIEAGRQLNGNEHRLHSQTIARTLPGRSLSMRILIADDNRDSVETLALLCQTWGFDPIYAYDGHQALALLHEPDSPMLCLLDWEMPVLTGIEICEIIRGEKDRPYLYMILITGRADRPQMVKGLDAGADDFLFKPIEANEFEGESLNWSTACSICKINF